MMGSKDHESTLKKWRLILGKVADEERVAKLSGEDAGRDTALGTLYDNNRKGDLSGSSPNVNKWLGDIRTYFPDSIQTILQKDAVDKLGIVKFLEAPEVLDSVVPDVQLAYTILSLKDAIPDRVKDTARQVIERLAHSIERKLSMPVLLAARKGVQRYQRKVHRNNKLLDWPRTIRYNLKNYDPIEKRIIPEKIFGFNARKNSLREIFILLDQSGSMSSSMVYTGIIASILHKLPTLQTHLIAFDSSVADLTELLHDPVELLFGVQMGGGTDIIKAMTYTRQKIRKPREAIIFLISDLYDNAPDRYLVEKIISVRQDGVKIIIIPALSDDGKSDFNKTAANMLVDYDVPSIACTPDRFCEILPDVIAG